MGKGKDIIVLSSDSEDVNDGPSNGKVPKDVNDGPSKGKFPKGVNDGLPTELLKWYGYADKKITVGTIGKNLLFYEDTKYIPVRKSASQKAILKSHCPVTGVVLGLANDETWDAIVQKIKKRPGNYADIGNSADEGKGKAQI
ncbi:hypothetical protein Tco_1446182 [Tanacetum coccineum]